MTSRCTLILLFLFAFPPWTIADSELRSIDLTNWEYCIGDSPLEQGKPTWTAPSDDKQPHWKPIDFPSNPNDRNSASYAWFRTQLPTTNLKDPVLYIFSVDLIVQVYLGNQKIYEFGDFTGDQKNRFIGWPWHQIELPNNYANQYIYFRVFSDYTDLGLWGEVKLIERADLLLFIVKENYSELLCAAFCLFIAFLAFVCSYIKGNEQKIFFHLAMFALVSATTIIGENQAVQLIFNHPLIRNYLAAGSYFLTPVFMGFLLFYWLGPKAGAYMCLIARLHLAYMSIALSLSIMGAINLASTYPPFDALFSVSLLIILVSCLLNLKEMNREQKLVVSTFGIYAILLLLDMWVAHSLIPWVRINTGLGSLLFAISLVSISLYHYNRIQNALRELNETLENKVRQRTASLQKYIYSEQERASQLEFIHNANLKLADLISHIQKTSSLSHAVEIIYVELPLVFTPIPCFFNINRGEHKTHLTNTCYQIQIQNLEGKQEPFAQLNLEFTTDFKKPELQTTLNNFITRVIDTLGMTLTSIKIREDLHRLSYEDALTGIRNRRYLDDALEREIQQSKRYKRHLSLLICDLDHFKEFNDDLGHEAGDFALAAVAKEMRKFFTGTDIPCRYGGEEFVVLMPNVQIEEAKKRADEFRIKIANLAISYHNKSLPKITLSIGVASLHGTQPQEIKILQAADKALYEAKLLGRNRVECVRL